MSCCFVKLPGLVSRRAWIMAAVQLYTLHGQCSRDPVNKSRIEHACTVKTLDQDETKNKFNRIVIADPANEFRDFTLSAESRSMHEWVPKF
jgi:hypothetical protein